MRSGERRLVTETPEMHTSQAVQTYISKEVSRPCKQWIHDVLSCKREAERVKLRTPDFVLLPDVECISKRPKADSAPSCVDHPPPYSHAYTKGSTRPTELIQAIHTDSCENRRQGRPKRHPSSGTPSHTTQTIQNIFHQRQEPDIAVNPAPNPIANPNADPPNTMNPNTNPATNPNTNPNTNTVTMVATNRSSLQCFQCFHWLAVATDTNLRTLRDLRGCHAPMLRSLYTQACQRIQEETGVSQQQVMAYIHYPPSVYQLHVHFKHLAAPGASHDTLRVHPLQTILNNLEIDPEYYARSRLQVPVYTYTELHLALDHASLFPSPQPGQAGQQSQSSSPRQ